MEWRLEGRGWRPEEGQRMGWGGPEEGRRKGEGGRRGVGEEEQLKV
jgi:hypothetical protein